MENLINAVDQEYHQKRPLMIKVDPNLTIKTRLKIYKDTTEPVIEHYEKLSLLIKINAVGDLKTISADIKQKMACR